MINHAKYYLFALLCTVIQLQAFDFPLLESKPGVRTDQKKPLTFLVFIAGDNNLYEFIQDDLSEMEKIGTNENVNILAYVNTKFPGQDKFTKRLVVFEGVTYQDGPDLLMDSGDPQTVIDACAWAHESYPSDHFVLVFWDHGSGSLNRLVGGANPSKLWWQRNKTFAQDALGFGQDFLTLSTIMSRAVCYDDTTGNVLTDSDLHNSLGYVCKNYRDGKPIDIIAFDACLMADVEIAYALQPYARYMVASQETIPGTGYGYDYALSRAAQGETNPDSLVRAMVHAYNTEYQDITGEYTLSALDLNKLDPIVNNINYVANFLDEQLQGKKRKYVKKAIQSSSYYKRCTSFDDKYFDIIDLYYNLEKNIKDMKIKSSRDATRLKNALRQGRSLINDAIIVNVKGDRFPRATGLSIYLTRDIDRTYSSLLWSQDTNWFAFLKQYGK